MSLGPLVAADELTHHQVVDTFASVGQSDQAWTEKLWGMAAAIDGSLSLGFGLGKYTNRGVMDACGAVSRGTEQWTVRASRSLGRDPDRTEVGPLRYEILEPLRSVRFSLDANDIVPISFSWTFEGSVPPFLEEREFSRTLGGARTESDTARFHQSGTARGWVDIDGHRVEVEPTSWVSTRDRSWGVRRGVGVPAADLRPRTEPDGVSTVVMWCPVDCRRPDGSHYALHWYYQSASIAGHQHLELQGGVEHPDGTKEHFGALRHHLVVDDTTRRFRSGELEFTMRDGTARPLTVTAVSDTGVHLGTGLYFGFDGHYHGEWRGRSHLDGEYLPDCTDPAVLRRIHQLRDCIVRVEDPVGGGVGWGNLETIVTGPDESLGLTAEASFL